MESWNGLKNTYLIGPNTHTMSHSTLNDNLIVYGNHSLWSKDEREESFESSRYVPQIEKTNVWKNVTHWPPSP